MVRILLATFITALTCVPAYAQVPPGFPLEIARGAVQPTDVIKFGRNSNFETAEDLWDTGATFVAPTVARLHDIVSTDADDDGAPVGDGARTIRVWGLTSWTAAEVTEDIILNGVTNVPTVNAYVIIHRMMVLTSGTTDINVGVISATAQTDSTVTAQIAAGVGQTRMAIYGIPTGKTLYISSFQASLSRAVPAANVDVQLLVNHNPDAQLTNFIQKHRITVLGAGTSADVHTFAPWLPIPGPAIVKLEVTSDTAATGMDGGFDAYLVTTN